MADSSSTSLTDNQTFDFANLVFLNVATQAPICLSSDNIFTWKAQWDALLYGYALTGYIDGSLMCPPSSSNVAYMYWTRQDQLLYGSLLASLSCDLAPMVASAKTSRAADELALLNAPLKDEEITIYVINGLNSDLKEISAALRSRDTEIFFEHLHERLLEYEAYLHKTGSQISDDAVAVAHVVNHTTSSSGFNLNFSRKPGS
ncbi:uncharacterized protein LOC132803509 [Ziziphus jujuba]|uniref:Uncharacterized protein LOC132803509 n=1 Tax=Ziziphus jujuba TaxID=326968 RepID=A0ABM4A7G8_ZIZJJ|nr:uncharacterized protein LOC132803509 [Ziziphus jujuba]